MRPKDFVRFIFVSVLAPILAMKPTNVRTVFLGTSVPHAPTGTGEMLLQVWDCKMLRTPSKLVKRLTSVKRE